MAEHPNAGLIRRGYEAFGKGDMATLTELFAEDAVWHMPGSGPVSGVHRGRDAVFAGFAKFFELSGGTLKIDIHDVLANDEHVVALVNVSGEREGKTLNDHGAQVFHVLGGKVTESWFHPGDPYAGDEFWS